MSTTIFSELLLPITLVLITLGLGLSIRLEDLKNLVKDPKNITVGLLSQLILLPLIAFSIAWIFAPNPLYAVGLILIAVCPGGATSNLVTFMINGNVALSVSLTAVNGIITIYTIPIFTRLALNIFLGQDSDIDFSLWEAVVRITLITVLPAASGVLIRNWWPQMALKMEKPLRYVLPVLLFMVYAGVLFLEDGGSSPQPQDYFQVLPLALLLNFLAISAGFFFPAFFGIGKRNRYTIAIEVGLQNSTLALLIALSMLGNPTISLVPVVYGSFSFFTTWGLGYVAKRFLK